MIAGRAVAAAAVLVSALVLGNALRDARASVPATPIPDAGTALSGGTASSTPTGNCVLLGRVAPQVAAPLEVVDANDGTKRITSAEGGFALAVPGSWVVWPGQSGPPAYAQAHATSYEPKTAPTPDPERWMLPPSVGISLDVQVWMNADRAPLERFADNIHIGPDQMSKAAGETETIGGQAAYRFTINDEHRFQPSGRPLVVTKQTRIVWLIQSPIPDRVIVAWATPGESALLATVERAVTQIALTQPVLSQRPVTNQRDEILKKWTRDKNGVLIAGRRVEAKLMTYAEANAAMNRRAQSLGPTPAPKPIQLLRLDHDPDDLYWVVAVSGPDLPQGRFGGPPLGLGAAAGTPTPTAWMLYDTSATGDNVAGTGAQFATQGSWPPGFDALPDRCR